MANKTIIAVNNTAGDITLKELSSIVVPAASQVDLTPYFTLYEVQKSAELEGYIQAGDILINTGTETLTSVVSYNYLTPMAVVSESDPNSDIEANTQSRHNQIHTFAGSDHNVDTKANVESKISDVSLLLSNAASEINSFTEITDTVNVAANTTWVIVEDGSISNAKRKIHIENLLLSGGGISNATYVEDDAPSTTTSTTFQVKLAITIPMVAGGIYRAGYSMEFNAGNANKIVEVEFYDATRASILGSNTQETNSTNNYFSFAGIHYEEEDTTRDHTFQLLYRQVTAACTVRNAVIEVFRVD